MNILVINGPNINMLGLREPHLYGSQNYTALCEKIENYAKENNVKVEFFQSNHEGCLVDCIQEAYGKFDGIHTRQLLKYLLNVCQYPPCSVKQKIKYGVGLIAVGDDINITALSTQIGIIDD